MKLQSIILWILLPGSLLVYDPHLRFACRDIKPLFQLPLIALFIGLWLCRPKNPGQSGYKPEILDILLISAIAFSFLAFLRAPSSYNALFKLVNISYYLVFMAVLRNYIEKHPDPYRLILPLIVGGALSSIYGILQFYGHDPIFDPARNFDEQRWVVAGFIGQQTLFAGVIGPLVPITLLAAKSTKSGIKKFLFILSAILITIAVVLTHTRALILGYFLALLTGILLFLFNSRSDLFKKSLTILMVFILIGIFAISLFPSFQTRMMEGVTLKSTSIRARFHYWRASYLIIARKPILGWGLGSFQTIYPHAQIELREKELPGDHNGKEIVTHPHNEYILLLTEGGVLLLIAFLALGIFIVMQGIRNFVSNRKDSDLALGSVLGLLIIAVDAFFSFPFHVGPSALIAVIFSALVLQRPGKIMGGHLEK